MIFTRSGRSVFPLLPPYGAHDPSNGRIIPLHPDGLTPYLGLRARLSQVWINRWTILLILVLVRVLIAIGGVRSDMASAKREALSACTSVESMGSAMASMPHYLASGVNELTASGIDHAVNGLNTMLMLTITGVEEIILFIIKIMYQTYLCLATMVVRSSVHVATELIEEVAGFLNTTIKAAVKDVKKTVTTFEDALNEFASLVNTAASALGADLPTLNLNSSLSSLDNIAIPSSINTTLDKLSDDIPSFDEVQNFTENVIRLPFEEVKKLVNGSLGTYSFDRNALSVPQKQQLSFCDDNDGINSFFQGVTDIAVTARKIFIAVILIAAVLACVPVAWQEIRRWRQMKERSQLVRKEAHDPMDVVYIVSRPYTAATGIKAASRFSNSRRQILVRWAVAYATSMPALFVLGIAIAALLSCLCQYILLRSVEKVVPELSTEVGEYADKVVSALTNASVAWATDANKAIDSMDDDLNNKIFGWVNTSTTAVNDTLETFVVKTQNVLNETFGGTLLEEPVQELFDCLIGLKIESVQKGLTWVHDHAHIDFPHLPNDTFSRGANASISNDTNASDSFLADAGDTTSNKITEVVQRVIDKLKDGLRTETLIATAILLLWVLIALIGILRAMTLFWGRERNRGDGGGHAMDPVPNNPAPAPESREFTDIPLTAIPRNELGFIQAVPRYETPVASSAQARGETSLTDEKLGFAGQRDYDSALKVDAQPALRKSNYVEYDVKRG
ncbi:Plasma membrane fusion protein prm1 [Penicillium cataractarum]|uniref:Plasma membrane fusion protein PRM1 n=1 Tax=Penicillium cataractarum TaxID=2100454 RepID=A0A9W9SLC1_9EURO|nr:Plasma membrane fusion protein prm1 [Penicillium cataractarum]KAJ5380372.1 Plasma membrane fusion protein prm1 [Penicillium cataractarum]